MNIRVLPNLRALTNQEAEEFYEEGPVAGVVRAGGIGMVRVHGTQDVNWMAVRCRDMPNQECPQHPGRQMSLLKTVNSTQYNLVDTLYYSCQEIVGTNQGFEKACGYNIYVAFNSEHAELALANPDVLMAVWDSKKE